MSELILTDEFFAEAAGWQVMKRARGLLANGQVIRSEWKEPLLTGVVRIESRTFRAGLKIKDRINIENICPCRDSREWGTICAHSVALGLHFLRREKVEESAKYVSVSSLTSGGSGSSGKSASKVDSAPGKNCLKTKLQETGGGGLAMKIHVILPPNLQIAVSKGKMLVCLEGETPAKRLPLNVLPKDKEYTVSEEDGRLLKTIEKMADGATPGMLMLHSSLLVDLLDTLAGHPRVTSGKTKAVQVSLDCPELSLHAGLCDNGEIKLSIRGCLEDPLLIRGGTLWMLQDYSFLRLPVPDSLSDLLSGEKVIPRYEVPAFLNGDYNRLKNEFSLTSDFELDQFDWNPMEPKIVLELKGGLAQLAGSIQFVYGSRVFQSGKNAEDSSAWFPDPDSPTVYSTRNLSSEKRAMERLRRVGFSAPDAQGDFEMLGRPTVLSFFAGEYGRMCREWEVSLEERLHRSTERNILSIEPRFEIRASGEQWFEMDISYVSSDGQTFSQVEVQDLLRSGKGYRPMSDGRMAMIDTGAVEELQEVLRDCAPMQKDGTYRFSNAQAGFLYNSLKENQAWRLDASEDWKKRALIQSGEIQPDVPDLGKLNDVARPYQKNGIGWMIFLRSNGFGGILADEMGLGKTLQALAFLVVVKKMSSEETHLPSLVVCPTSLVFNWQAEAEKFTPELKVLALNGTNRHRLFRQIPKVDLVITSYALIRRDLPKYAELSFDTLILDEAQHIKNRETRNAQAVKSIRAGHRLVLTGTPLENSVLDLWSIFDFLMPGYLGTAKDFKERFELPITHEKDGNTRQRLARRIRPFLLRREKSEVAADLPEKIEQVSFCELSKDQKALYQQILETGQSQIGQASGDGSNPKNRMMVLQTLLRLRQICCDLRLLKLPDLKTKNPSGKLELFEELLEEILDGGHRVLVFSQFVKMLHLIRTRLEERGVAYSYLDGKTRDRKAVVDEFQGRSDIPVFLISLKAGGLGLNLTAADTVIHFDPWWNPAVESQATDRVHRIGQTRVVTSYKMIARGTVEEKILKLQKKKKDLLKGMIGDESEFLEKLTWEEIQGLLND